MGTRACENRFKTRRPDFINTEKLIRLSLSTRERTFPREERRNFENGTIILGQLSSKVLQRCNTLGRVLTRIDTCTNNSMFVPVLSTLNPLPLRLDFYRYVKINEIIQIFSLSPSN